jgi:5-formyltetrahydrofolate cyclo-ligase
VGAHTDEAKKAIRSRVWDLLVRERVAEPGVHGYVPAFVGAEAAADRLAGLPEWRAARAIPVLAARAAAARRG